MYVIQHMLSKWYFNYKKGIFQPFISFYCQFDTYEDASLMLTAIDAMAKVIEI